MQGNDEVKKEVQAQVVTPVQRKSWPKESCSDYSLYQEISNEDIKGRIPRVFCDEFVTKFVTKFGDKYSESPNIVINFWTKLVTNVVRNCIL